MPFPSPNRDPVAYVYGSCNGSWWLRETVTFRLSLRHPGPHEDSTGNSLLMKGGNVLKHHFKLSSENTGEQELLDFWCHLKG